MSHPALWPGWRGALGTVVPVAPEQPGGTGRQREEEPVETDCGGGARRAHAPAAGPSKPAQPPLPFFPRCPAHGHCPGPDRQSEGQTEGESRNSSGLRSGWIPPPPPPMPISLEKDQQAQIPRQRPLPWEVCCWARASPSRSHRAPCGRQRPHQAFQGAGWIHRETMALDG